MCAGRASLLNTEDVVRGREGQVVPDGKLNGVNALALIGDTHTLERRYFIGSIAADA
jgi:hypothetical protein